VGVPNARLLTSCEKMTTSPDDGHSSRRWLSLPWQRTPLLLMPSSCVSCHVDREGIGGAR
jgi:hypothetical protein